MLEGDENVQQDANEVQESSAPETASPETQASEQVTAPEPSSAPAEPKSVPFHEDPRVQEYLERQIKKNTETYEQRMQEMQRQVQALQPKAEPKQAHEFVQQLKQINPKWAEYIESLESKAGQVEQLTSRINSWEQKNTLSTYESTMAKMHAEFKTPDDLKERIKREIEFDAMRNPKLGISDLPGLYKQKFEDYSKWLDGIKRAERAAYVSDKSKDSKAPPTQPKGKVPARNDKGQFQNMDREEMMASVVKSALNKARAESDI